MWFHKNAASRKTLYQAPPCPLIPFVAGNAQTIRSSEQEVDDETRAALSDPVRSSRTRNHRLRRHYVRATLPIRSSRTLQSSHSSLAQKRLRPRQPWEWCRNADEESQAIGYQSTPVPGHRSTWVPAHRPQPAVEESHERIPRGPFRAWALICLRLLDRIVALPVTNPAPPL